jgi:hypothetical protein
MQQDRRDASWWRSPAAIVCVGLLAIGAFFLLTEHTAHVLGLLPYLLLAACPLMHLFHRHGRGHGIASSDRERDDSVS